MKKTLTLKELEAILKRVKSTYSYLENTPIKDIYLMAGTRTAVAVCNSIFSIAEFKKEYMEKLKYRAIELELEISQLKKLSTPEATVINFKDYIYQDSMLQDMPFIKRL
jgi:hypothetical protein